MKSIHLLFLLFINLTARGQSIGIFGGKTLMSGEFVAIKYEHPSNYIFQFSAQAFLETTRLHGLHYSAYGLDLFTEYASNQDPSSKTHFSYRLGVGANIQLEEEPWVYSSWKTKQKIGFGFTGETAVEWAMSTAFSLSSFIQQKYVFRVSPGYTGFVFGLGIKYSLGN